MKNYIYIVIVLLTSVRTTLANNKDSIDYPVIGKPIPQFVLQDVKYFERTTVTNEDLKGKWFMLDFWGEYCAGCIASFPKMNAIQKEHGDVFQLILIGVPHKKQPISIEKVYETHRQNLNLQMPITFDRKLADQFHLYAYPHQIIVDPQGIVRYITSGVSEDDVKKIINGDNPSLSRVYNAVEPRPYDQFDHQIPLLMDGNGGPEENYYLRSIFTYASKEMPLGFSYFTPNYCQLLRFGLEKFYKYALTGVLSWANPQEDLYGKVWPEIVLEIADSSMFKYDPINFTQNNFAFSAFVSEKYRKDFGSQKINFASLLKKELEVTLPYTASLQRRSMPCYELHVSEEAFKKIISKKSKLQFKWLDGYRIGFAAEGMNMVNFRSQLIESAEYNKDIPLVYNGPDVLIDITLKSTYFEDRVKELKELGIEIRKTKRTMDVIVIQDK